MFPLNSCVLTLIFNQMENTMAHEKPVINDLYFWLLAWIATVVICFYAEPQRFIMILLNLITLVLYSIDEVYTMIGSVGQISESVLLAFGLLGGWVGAIIAQQIFRHRRRESFQYLFIGSIILNVILMCNPYFVKYFLDLMKILFSIGQFVVVYCDSVIFGWNLK